MQQMQEAAAAAAPPPPFEHVPAPVPEPNASFRPRFSEPDAFDGQRDVYEAWKVKALFYVQSHQAIYPTDRDKVAYIFQRLSGRAYDQLIPIMSTANTNHEAPELNSLEQALEKLDALFGQVNRVEEAAAKLATLRQKPSERVAEYSAEFQRLLAIVGPGESEYTQCVRFRNGLRWEVSDR